MASWDKSPVFSVRRFLLGKGVALLTIPEKQVESIGPVARLLLRKVKDETLTDSDHRSPGTLTILFDEWADLHGLSETVYPLFGRARSSRVSVWTAWQSWPAVCNTHGEGAMKGLLDNASVRLWFGCGADSADIASKFCGAAEVKRWDESYAYGRENSRTVSSRVVTRPHVLPGEFSLPSPQPGDLRVRGFLTASHLPGPVYFEEDYGPFIDFLNRIPRVKAHRPRPVADQWLVPWDDLIDGTALEELFREEV